MPFITDPDGYKAGGKRGVNIFEGVYAGFEDDLPNEFQPEKLRTRFIFTDVEIIDSESPVELKNGGFDFYINQSESDRSAGAYLANDWRDAGETLGVEGDVFHALQGRRLRMEKVEYEFGGDFKAIVYVPSVTDAPSSAPVDDSTTTDAEDSAPDTDDPLYDFVVAAAGEGTTATSLSSALAKAPAAIRKAAIAAGGGKAYIQSLVDNGLLDEEDGVISAPAF